MMPEMRYFGEVKVNWQEFDVNDRRKTRPVGVGHVWVYDPVVWGVTIAHYDHITPDDETGFFTTCDGRQLTDVTHWAYMSYPEEPEGRDD